MKIKLLLLLSAFVLLTGCSDDDDNNTQVESTTPGGNYTGTFERNGTVSTVSFTFDNGNFTGESDTDRLPAICNGQGNYAINGNMIMFEHPCIWTADFDWTLILDGEWSYTATDTTLVFTKANGDVYTLTRV